MWISRPSQCQECRQAPVWPLRCTSPYPASSKAPPLLLEAGESARELVSFVTILCTVTLACMLHNVLVQYL